MPTVEDLMKFHEELTTKAREVSKRKSSDYSGATVIGNLMGVEGLSQGEVSGEKGILIRMQDKLSRAWTLVSRDPEVVGEGLEDVAIDLVNYSVLLLWVRYSKITSVTLTPTPDQVMELMTKNFGKSSGHVVLESPPTKDYEDKDPIENALAFVLYTAGCTPEVIKQMLANYRRAQAS